MAIQRNTKQRAAVLQAIEEGHPDCGHPPYDIGAIAYMLGTEDSIGAAGALEYYQLSKPIPLRSLHRILNDLHREGLITFEMKMVDASSAGRLPRRQRHWQIAGREVYNGLFNELAGLMRRARVVHGCTNSFFGKTWDEPAKPEAERRVLTDALKSFLQRTHPDKVDGCADLFSSAKTALDYVRTRKKVEGVVLELPARAG
ncbi:hypothetical protein F6R98_19980 [Candidatus Methylospira mobilis]|uniref:Uncharacterized protein n=1 Tax=Candidatus Methylospira mobilis TaxID=1808979 RepID=A0A5Q0BLA8_9GAMM|nr:hypothetical protein [Candidatus Methylospira mobilis]QFY44623.1 hypothetical protein F6R98_19980 [Candidatus Methylospira mobilis]